MKLKLLTIAVVAALVGLLAAYEKPVSNLNSYTAVCGSAYIDGGVDPSDDAGHLDGGYTITELNDGTFKDAILVGNPSTTVVYIGDSAVQPDDGFPICTTAASCTRSDFSADVIGNELYCTATSAATVRVVTAGL